MRDTKSILLVLLSGCLVGTWAYHFYDKSIYTSPHVIPGAAPEISTLPSTGMRRLPDTPQAMAPLNGDPVKVWQDSVSRKMAEIIRLRNEIAGILLKQDLTREDLQLARQKTSELEQRVRELEARNSSIEDEKTQIGMAFRTVSDRVVQLENTVRDLNTENRQLKEKMEQSGTFVASDLKLVPVMVRNDKEQETSLAQQTAKLVVSFNVQNNAPDKTDNEVYVIVTQPDGKVLKTDVWESFSVDTRQDGRRSYTRKVRFDYAKGQTRNLLFTLSPDNYLQGTYQLELYHNGYRIGSTYRTLN